MYYYNIAVSSNSLKGVSGLTYSYKTKLLVGNIVQVELRKQMRLGIVMSKTIGLTKQKIKPIKKVYNTYLPSHSINLLNWINHYYPGDYGSCVSLFLPNIIAEDVQNTNLSKTSCRKPPPLTKQQTYVIKNILNKPDLTYMLHGDTGTGKTRVYIELAQDTLSKNRSVILLVPEISLSPQLKTEFERVFGNIVFVFHSKLTLKQRAILWRQINDATCPIIIIGPRSALFTPVQDVGLIVIDEAHDDSYKQSQSPHYDARRVAAKLGIINRSIVVYGTATPNISDYEIFKNRNIPILRMDKPVNEKIQPANITQIDSKDRSNFSKSTIFSNTMINEIEKSLDDGSQILIFLNRRGTARMVICESCGWLAVCSECDTNLIYHSDSHELICHICGRKTPTPSSCPDCHKTNLSFKSHGTKSIENELRKLLPSARIMRFDSDNSKLDSLSEQYDKIVAGDVDIIIGTQIIAKGLHLPKLNLVCIPFAETGITMPDFSSEEKSYQLLRQVIGRVGRTHNKSKIIIQSFSQDNLIIKSIVKNNWDTFVKSQLAQRKKYRLPPYYYLLQLTIRRKTNKNAQDNAENLKKNLKIKYPNAIILGPSPRFHNKINGTYNWQLIIKSKSRNQLLTMIDSIPSGWQYNIDPVNLL